MKRLGQAESERQKVIEVQQVIKLSNTTGHPTLTNPSASRSRRGRKKKAPPPPPNRTRGRTLAQDHRRDDGGRESSLAGFADEEAYKEQAAALARPPAAAGGAARLRGRGRRFWYSRKNDFEELLESLGLGARPPDKDEGVPSPQLFRVRADEWWAATDVYKAGGLGLAKPSALPKDLTSDEDKKQRTKCRLSRITTHGGRGL